MYSSCMTVSALRRGAPPHGAHQGLRITGDHLDDGLQTGRAGRTTLEESEQLSAHRPGRRGCEVRRRSHRKGGIEWARRNTLNPSPDPQDLTIPLPSLEGAFGVVARGHGYDRRNEERCAGPGSANGRTTAEASEAVRGERASPGGRPRRPRARGVGGRSAFAVFT